MNRTGVFYLSFNPGPGRQPIALSGEKVYIRVVTTALGVNAARRRATPDQDEQLLAVCRLGPTKTKGGVSILTRAIALLTEQPFLTSTELGRKLNADVSTVSSLLYREMLRPNNRVSRQKSSNPGRGMEWFVSRRLDDKGDFILIEKL